MQLKSHLLSFFYCALWGIFLSGVSPAQAADFDKDAILVVQSDALDQENRFAVQAALVTAAEKLGLKLIPPDEVGVYENAVLEGECQELQNKACLLELGTMALAKYAVSVQVQKGAEGTLNLQGLSVQSATGIEREVKLQVPALILESEKMRDVHMGIAAVRLLAPHRIGKMLLRVNEADAEIKLDGVLLDSALLQTPLVMTEGTHVLQVAKDGFTMQRRNLIIRSHVQKDVKIALKKAGSGSKMGVKEEGLPMLFYTGMGIAGAGVGMMVVGGGVAGVAYSQAASAPSKELVGELQVLSSLSLVMLGSGALVTAVGGTLAATSLGME